MQTITESYLQTQLEERRRRLETAMSSGAANGAISALLSEVDAALERMRDGSYGICEECHDPVEQERLLADPLVRLCIDHLNEPQRRALERDLELASSVQRALLPPHDVHADGWQIHYCYEPAGVVSGDYCDVIPPRGDDAGGSAVFLALGDVSGKGVAASLMMTQLHAMFRSLASSGMPLSELLERVNRLFCESTTAGQYATLVCARASAGGVVELSSAGHLPVFVLRNGEVQSLEANSMPLGMFYDGDYPTQKMRLEAGESLVFYTDGLSESRDRANREYGFGRLGEFLRGRHALAPDALTAACLDEIKGFAAMQHDDRTMLVLRRA